MKAIRLVLCGVLVAGLLAGCSGGGGGGGKPKVGFVTNNPHEFWTLVEAGCKAQAEKDGLDLDFQRPQKGIADQKSIVEAMVAGGVKAISISVIDPEGQTSFLDTIGGKVALLAVDNDAPKSKRRCYIGTDNVKAGRAVGKLIKEANPTGATVALFVGQLTHNGRGRIKGVLDELEIDEATGKSKDGKYVLHRNAGSVAFTDDTSSAKALENAQAVLVQTKDEPHVVLVGLWAYNPPAILTAVERGMLLGKVTIVGFDEDLDTLQGVANGHIYGTVVQNPYEFGRKSVEVMGKLAKGEAVELPADGIDHIPERMVTKEGGKDRLKASEYAQKIKQILGK